MITTPNYFLETRLGEDYPPAITHPEFFYGFVGTCLAWQLAYLLIATDPVRYRPRDATGRGSQGELCRGN